MSRTTLAVPVFNRGAEYDPSGQWKDPKHSTKNHPPKLEIIHHYYDHVDTDDNDGTLVSGTVTLRNTSDRIPLADISVAIEIDVPGLYSVAFYDAATESWVNSSTWILPDNESGQISGLAPQATSPAMKYYWTLQKPRNHKATAGDVRATIVVSPTFTVKYPDQYPPFRDQLTVTIRDEDA